MRSLTAHLAFNGPAVERDELEPDPDSVLEATVAPVITDSPSQPNQPTHPARTRSNATAAAESIHIHY